MAYMYVQVAPQTIGRTVAIFPDTFSHCKFHGEIDLKSPYVIAYWHDFHKNGRHRVSYGVARLNMRMADTLKPLDQLDVNDFLQIASSENMDLTPAHTVSNFTKDYNRHLYFQYPGFEKKYDRLDLRGLMLNPDPLPGDSIGWFKLVK